MEKRQESRLGQHCAHVAKRRLSHIAVEYKRRNIRKRLDGRRRTIRCGNAVDDLSDTLLEMSHELDIKAAQRSLEHAGVGDDVGRQAASKLTNGKCDFLGRRHLAGDKLLERQVHVDAGRDGVDADLGARAMAALALERDAETVHARKRRTAVEHQAKRRLAVDVHGKGHLGARVLEQAVGDGSACSLKGLLARLEQQFDGGIGVDELGLAGLEQARRTKQSRRVHIVTASMHAAIGGCKGLAGFLDNGQGIHVATQHNDRSGLFVRADAIALGRGGTGTDKARNTGTIDERGKRDVHLGQARLDIRRGLRKAIAQLRRLVQVVAPRSKLVGKSLSLGNKTVTDSGLRCLGSLGRWLRLKIGLSWCHKCPPVLFVQQTL